MQYFKQPFWPLSTVATIALTSATFAETPATTETVMTIDEAAALLSPAAEQNGVFRKLTVPVAGMHSIHAPANSGIQVNVDGQLVLDASGTRIQEVGKTITAIITLEAGDHAIEVTGVSADDPDLWRVTLNTVGEEPHSIMETTLALDASEAETILSTRSALNSTATATSNATLASASVSDFGRMPFSIGGGSSQSTREAAQAALANASSASSGGAPTNTNTDTTSGMSGGTTAATTSTPTVLASSGGTVSNNGSSSGSESDNDSDGDDGDTDGGSTPTPTPTPGTPTVADSSVQVSPLTPPTGVTLTEAVQLTSAGNEDGEVSSTGTTLFGAVMNTSMFDIVNVAVMPVNRTAVVDVGPETGQFAVRLFEEDFAQGSDITVTLTGASSASDEVEATPISYALSGVATSDGVTQALSRITFGPSADLYARVRAMGFDAYVEEQLNPNSINDAAFEAMDPEDLLDRNTSNRNDLFRSLMAYDIAHAAYSEKQLQEVMGHFWANHFHATTKDTNMNQQNIDDRQFFRDNALGNFEDMLLYSARSPLMSQFLDNDQNRVGRINENYAREIMELSTVGVDGGYTEEDIIEVARIFTGWSYERTNPNADNVAQEFEFAFFPDNHDEEDKVISFLNITIAGRSGDAGIEEGEELIAILAQHPSTRTYVCGKIVQYLVADEPPEAFVEACAAAWETSQGNVVEMLRAILLDPAYTQTAEYQRNKGKTPFEYSVSSIRAFGAEPEPGEEESFYAAFRETFENAGQNILTFPVPTGLPEVSSAWANSASMINAYNEMTDIAERRDQYNVDLLDDVTDAGLETAEEVASYIMTIATADRFTLEEYDALVEVLKGDDGIFEPRVVDESAAFDRAMGLTIVTPSFKLQ